jgi:anti-sigma factor RsiW
MGKINIHNYEAFLIDYLDGNLNESVVAELKAFVFANPQLQIDLNDLDLPSFADEVVSIDFKEDLKKNTSYSEDEELIYYLENNLPEADRKVVERKLLTDKDLAAKLEAYKKTILKGEEEVFVTKNSLYKTENDLVLNNVTLAYVEGQLSNAEKLQFEKELKTDTILQKEVSLYKKTKLEIDAAIVFPDKEALKKEARVIALFNFRTVTSIAAAILLIIGLAFVFNYYTSKPNPTKELAKNNFDKTSKNIDNQIVKEVDSSSRLNEIIPENSNFVAKNTNIGAKNNSIKIKKDPSLELNEPKTNSVVEVNKQEEKNDSFINKEFNEPKNVIVKNNSGIDTTKVAIANVNSQPKYSKQTYLITEEGDADDEPVVAAPVKKGFWARAVKIAKQANKLGVKSLDGDESQGKNYSLSFNAFSVEKR